MVALVGVRLLVGDRLLITGVAASATFEGVLGAVAVTVAIGAQAKFAVASEVRWLSLAVGVAAFGGLHVYAVLVGIASPSGYLAAPRPEAMVVLGDFADLSLAIGAALSLLPRKLSHGNFVAVAVAVAGIAGLITVGLVLSTVPNWAVEMTNRTLDACLSMLPFAAIVGVLTGPVWRAEPMRLWLLGALCVLMSAGLPLAGVATDFSHAGVSLADIYAMAAIGLVIDGGFITLAADFTLLSVRNRDLEAKNRSLASMAQEVEQAARARSTFLGMVGHELRTPLNAVSGFSQLLATDPGIGEKQRRQAARIQDGASRLTEKVEDILALTASSSSLGPEAGSLNAPALLEPHARLAEPLAGAKGIRIDTQFEPALLPGTDEALGHALAKLVDNAVRFSAHGTISVTGRVVGDRYRVSVADQGPGIPPEFGEHLFEYFRQADEGPERRFGGLGLGLAVVKRLVDAMGGTVRYSSELGSGSTFVIEVPLLARTASHRTA